MLLFRDLLRFPPYYKDRQKSWQSIPIRITEFTKNEDSKLVIVKSTDGKYTQSIEMYSIIFDLKAPVKIVCTCPSFTYEFAYAVYKIDSLFGEPYNPNNNFRKPKEKNKYVTPCGCKHIIAASNFIAKNYRRLFI